MALIVEIKVNNETIIRRWCRRVDGLLSKEFVYNYETDDGRIIKHRYSDGAEKLAVKLLGK